MTNHARWIPMSCALTALILAFSCSENDGKNEPASGQDGCPPGQASCGELGCFDLDSNPGHCGECSRSCSVGQTCSDGTCVCSDGYAACGDACVHLESNPDHCGACDTSCSGQQVCQSGQCQTTCADGFENCERQCVNLATDDAHCGACGAACPVQQACVDGECTCEAPLAMCGDECVNLMTDAHHCGGCSTPCDAGQSCVEGVCSGSSGDGGSGGTGGSAAGGSGGAASGGTGPATGGTGGGSGDLVVKNWVQGGSISTDEVYTIFAHDGVWYAGTFDDGLWTSDDDGNSWDKINDAPADVNDMVSFKGNLYLAGGDLLGPGRNPAAGVYQSSSGNQWTKVTDDKLQGNDVPVSLHVHDGVLFAGGQEGKVARSTDGSEWKVNDDLKGVVAVISDFASFRDRIYLVNYAAGEKGVYHSADGTDWQGHDSVEAVGLEIEATSRALLATTLSEFYRSTDGSEWMQQSRAGVVSMFVVSDVLYGLQASSQNETNAVLGTDDDGTSWIDVTANLPAAHYAQLASDGSLLMVAVEDGSNYQFWRREL